LLLNNKTVTTVTGNEQYAGFIRDLLDALAEELDVDYGFQLADGYGREEGGKWTGMIGQVVRQVNLLLMDSSHS